MQSPARRQRRRAATRLTARRRQLLLLRLAAAALPRLALMQLQLLQQCSRPAALAEAVQVVVALQHEGQRQGPVLVAAA